MMIERFVYFLCSDCDASDRVPEPRVCRQTSASADWRSERSECTSAARRRPEKSTEEGMDGSAVPTVEVDAADDSEEASEDEEF